MRTLLLVGLVSVAACGGDRPAGSRPGALDSTEVDSSMALVARAAAVTLGAREFPASADSVLAASGFTIEEYESLLYRISGDPLLSQLYRDAIGGKN